MQVGDPFEEKKLLECSLELLERGLLVSLQDLGAAGLTSSASEMASKGEVGIDIDVARVPLREPGMEPFEIMVSRVPGADAVRGRARGRAGGAGAVREVGGRRRGDRDGHRHAPACACFDGERLVGDMPVRALVDDCPLYDLRRRGPTTPIYARPAATLAPDASPRETLLALLRSPEHRLAPAAVRAVRRDRAVAHGAPPRAGRRRGAGADRPPAEWAPGTGGGRAPPTRLRRWARPCRGSR